jgi:actin-related protein
VIKDKQVLNTEYMLHLVEQAFVAHSCASPDEQPLLLAASARVQISDRLLYECMERFNVPAIATAESEILALYSHGQTDGVVVDVGYECTIIIPIVEGMLYIAPPS